MNPPAAPRAHLVERAMEALGGMPPSLAPPPTPPGASHGASPSTAEPPLPAATNDLAPATPPAPALTPALVPPLAPGAPVTPLPTPAIDMETLRRAGYVGLVAAALRSRVTEEFSVIQQQVLRTVQAATAEDGRISRMILVTSARPAEGKTFCSLNLAVRLALNAPEQVVLVDADGKKADSITERLGQSGTPGLRLLAGDPLRRPETLLLPTAVRRLQVLPYGPPGPEGGGLPSGAMLAAALGRLAAALPQRILVVDAAPCLATSEPAALAAVAGQVVVVVRAESTPRNEVEGALDMLDSCPTLQLLLNRTRLLVSDAFGSYGYYGA